MQGKKRAPPKFRAPFAEDSKVKNEALYQVQADQVLDVSANLSITYLYGDQEITAWGGPGQGTVTDLPASQWQAYLPVANHPEYPSASASFCAAHAQSVRLFLGTDALNWTIPAAQGSSRIEPGVTPQSDIALAFPTWTDFEQTCGTSRLWGGVHFYPSIPAGQDIGHEIGTLAYDYVDALIKGSKN